MIMILTLFLENRNWLNGTVCEMYMKIILFSCCLLSWDFISSDVNVTGEPEQIMY
jgi:hypothetical protein